MLAVAGIYAGMECIRAPESEQVGGGMIVGRADDRVIDLQVGGDAFADSNHVVMEEPDGVNGHEGNAPLAIVDDHPHGLKVIVNIGGRTSLAEPCHPDGLRRIVHVRV